MSVVDGLPFNPPKKKYILEVLDPVLEEMVSDVLTEMPKSPHEFMIQWLRKRNGVVSAGAVSISSKNKKLKQELVQITGSLKETSTAIAHKKPDDPQEEEEEEEEDDDCDEIPESFKKSEEQLGRARQSVSAEAYGQWNQKKDFTPPSYPKTDDQKTRLKATLTKSFMFSELDAKDVETILMAMKETPLTAGAKVITEGEDGDYLFVIESGTLDCVKNIDGTEKVVKTCNVGDVFGELALLYNCPRAASVVAKDNCICWQLDRETVNHIVKDAAIKRRTKYETFLKSVTLISDISQYERSQIADALKSESFSKGDTIVKELDPGDKFYIVEEGALYANKKLAGGSEKRVMNYKPGDYFGELALLKNQPRAASIVVESDTAKVLSMSRVSFTKMLGPLQHLLAARADVYDNPGDV
jgi:cAMP-dependent protein kinase regulator